MVEKFRKKYKKSGVTLKHWHRKNITGTSYGYFIVQLNDPDIMKKDVKKAIQKYLDEV